MKEENDLRGFDLKVDNFQTQLTGLINESNLPVSVVLYILKDCYIQVSELYDNTVKQQYQDFCKEVEKEEKQTDTEEE